MEYKRFYLAFMLLLGAIALGTSGYCAVENMPIFDALYMTIITISTVGFSEIRPLSDAGRMITIIIIITGISGLTYTAGQLFRMFIEGELSRVFGRRKLEKKISQLKDHYIVCGFGRVGTIICGELASENIRFIVIEQDPGKNEELEKNGYLFLNLDATTEEALIKAGISKAKGIVTAVRSDANNVFITLTAKGLRPDIFVLSRTSDVKNEEKLLKAGATRVVSPYLFGGRRMAQVLKRPTVADFIDIATMNSKLDLAMEEAVVGKGSSLIGKSLVDSKIRHDYGVIIVAIKKPSQEMIFNPMPTEKLEDGDVVVVIGKKNELKRMKGVMT